jgi:tripartite-type tricarboxylate transporter receptor subunit TctC
MDMRRLASVGCGLILFLASAVASATAPQWPEAGRSIQAIVPAQAGSGVGNTMARLIADALSARLGNRIVLQNFTSSNNFPGLLTSIEANTEGYTLLFATVDTLVIEPGLQRVPAFDPLQYFAPIGLVAEIPHILVVNNDLPVRSVEELTQYIAKYPGVVHFGSSGNGSAMHLAGESYLSATGTNMVHVPYSAAEPATNNLMSGDIQAMFQVVSGVLNYVRTDKLRALAVMSDQRIPALPDVPSMAEAGYPNLRASRWYALLAPRGTPQEIIDHYNAVLNETLASPELRERLLELGATPLGGTPEDLERHLAEETRRWGAVINDAHLQPR